MTRKRRSPHKAGNVAQAGGLSAWESYRSRALLAVLSALTELNSYADSTDDPAPGAVEAADLLDAARVVLGGAR